MFLILNNTVFKMCEESKEEKIKGLVSHIDDKLEEIAEIISNCKTLEEKRKMFDIATINSYQLTASTLNHLWDNLVKW